MQRKPQIQDQHFDECGPDVGPLEDISGQALLASSGDLDDAVTIGLGTSRQPPFKSFYVSIPSLWAILYHQKLKKTTQTLQISGNGQRQPL